MVSQRQRLARKRYKEAHPEEFPKPEPTPPKDPNKKRKKKSLFKKKKPTSSSGSSSTRHPLRVPGMKPGEGCYICKSKTHIAKLCPEKSEWERNKVLASFLSSLVLIEFVGLTRLFCFVCRYACNVEGEGIVLKTVRTRAMKAASRRSCVTTVEILAIHFLIVLILW